MTPWLYLTVSILTEVAGTTCLKLSDGFSRVIPALLVVLFYGLSFFFFALALKRIDLGVGYAIWAGVGTALVSVIGMTLFAEPVTPVKALSIAAIVAGVVGLNLSGAGA
jgi:small multidrug resistance pump